MPQKSTLRYLRYGFLLSILSIFALQAWCAWQVYQYAHAPAALPKHADAAVVLGAAAWGDKPSPVFRERINHAIALYQSERVEKLIFTGGTRKEGYPSEGEVARKFAIKQGIPSHDILYETRSKDTYQNLVNTRLPAISASPPPRRPRPPAATPKHPSRPAGNFSLKKATRCLSTACCTQGVRC